LGATQSVELLQQAKRIVFPTIGVPVDAKTRRIHLSESETSGLNLIEKLDELDQRFYRDPDRLGEILNAFAREQGLVSGEAED
jgi:Domain of unknown function (DUF4375)